MEMPKVSVEAEKLSYCTNLADVRKNMPADTGYEDWSTAPRGRGGSVRGRGRWVYWLQKQQKTPMATL